jgi:hypothetical protein
MRIARHLLIWSLIALVPAVLLKPVRLQFAAVLAEGSGTGAPASVHAVVPFVVHDSYAIQVCISSRSGRPLLPFILPADSFGAGTHATATADVRAGVPFLVRDANGMQVCVSTRVGQSFPPFVAP